MHATHRAVRSREHLAHRLPDPRMDRVAAYEKGLLAHATEGIAAIRGARVLGLGADRISVLSFTLNGMEPKTIEERLDQEAGIAVRSGPLDVESAVRASVPVLQYLRGGGRADPRRPVARRRRERLTYDNPVCGGYLADPLVWRHGAMYRATRQEPLRR